MDWQTRRKATYAFGLLICIAALSVYLARDILFPAPTCSDKKQNGYELGVDCGKPCALRCDSEVKPLIVLWAKAIRTSQKTYDIVGMVSNKNVDNAAHGAHYTFTILNKKGETIKEIQGGTVTPTEGDFPIIEPSVVLDQLPYSVTLTLVEGKHYTIKEIGVSPLTRIRNEHYEAGTIPRVYADISNAKRMTFENLAVKVVLFDEYDNAFAVGATVIPFLDKEETKTISFTWDAPLPATPTRIRVYPIIDPFKVTQ